jgi:hypothetical protein
MKPIPLEVLEHFLVGTTEKKPTKTTETTSVTAKSGKLQTLNTTEEDIEQAEQMDKSLTVSEELGRLLGPTRRRNHTESVKESSETAEPRPDEPLPVLEALVQARQNPTKRPIKPKDSASHIVDLTDQYIGKSLIFTGAAKPPEKKPAGKLPPHPIYPTFTITDITDESVGTSLIITRAKKPEPPTATERMEKLRRDAESLGMTLPALEDDEPGK